MGISNYLHEKAKEAILRDSKKESVQKSIKVIKERIDGYFDDVNEHFIFGSYTRNTILPRSIDRRADIDYMVVFKDNDLTPQSYLNKLRTFVEKYYSNSEIKQSHPTIQLELNHINFELVPALDEGWLGNDYQIPSRNNGMDEWISTDPNSFNDELTEVNQDNKDLIKPLIRLMKYWNAKNNYVFASYFLEQNIVETDYFWFSDKALKDYFYKYVETIEIDELIAQWKKDKINKLKERVANAQEKEEQEEKQEAENIIRKIFKDEIVIFNENAMALSHAEQPKWQMRNLHNVSIRALINGNVFNSNDLVDKGCGLIFNAQTNTSKPFNVYWQVVNTGKEALKAKCLRGEIFAAESAGVGGLIRKESTEYTGSHWVKCFIVKDNQCVAKSDNFIVRIK